MYRVGGVILQKERMLVSFEPRVLIRYTLLEAHSATTLRFRPFLAFAVRAEVGALPEGGTGSAARERRAGR